jgi:hypothetical protein
LLAEMSHILPVVSGRVGPVVIFSSQGRGRGSGSSPTLRISRINDYGDQDQDEEEEEKCNRKLGS